MRILHTSDWHLGKQLENINRLEEQRAFVDELLDIVNREKIDLVLIAGDVFDTYNPSSASEGLFYNAIEKLNDNGRRAIVAIAGNHDNPDRLCASSPLSYKNGIILLGYPKSNAGIYKCESNNIKLEASGCGWLELNVENCENNIILITLPYPSESRLEEVLTEDYTEQNMQKAYSNKVNSVLNELSKNFRDDTVNIIMSHIYLRDGKLSDSERQLGGAYVVEPELLPTNAHYVALGHLHRPQKVKNAPIPTYYSGSPLAYSFSETGYSKVVYIIDVEPEKETSIREVILSSGKPLKKWRAKNGLTEAMKWCEEGKDQNAWIDLEIYTDRIITAEEQKKLRELNRGIINIRPVISKEDTSELDYTNRETRRMDDLFRDYYKFKTGTEIAEDIFDVFLEVIEDEVAIDKVLEAGGEDIETKIS